MNWEKLFEIQGGLDEHIRKEKNLEGHDLLDKKILALQVELGELANEWRGFKFWSNYPKPQKAYNKGCDECVGGISKTSPLLGPYKECEHCRVNPLLEEYVDCLHFILSIGIEKGFQNHYWDYMVNEFDDITVQFNLVFDSINDFYTRKTEDSFGDIVDWFMGLGQMLGFTEQQIEAAYLEKNKVNHERQLTGY
ncbi:dUTP diphosphatase [Gracilibacillus saliphilus]|uniref:dUTP diphosphatase n=1 Tax=Gracilibacillus saliphilus TaxID=543890 RepID=UPI0013D5D788|nr:dUTP diphosphatase [Gracilibacillus saliphilus]